MSLKICVSANSLRYPEHGGHMWVYLNWCLGLKEIGYRVVWLDGLGSKTSRPPAQQLSDLRTRLERYGLAEEVAVWTNDDDPLPAEIAAKCFGIEAVVDADLLLNLCYETPARVVGHFRRSALIDIDPGLLQTWVSAGQMPLVPHTHYFTIGETVGRPDAKFPDLGLTWHYTPPPVCLEWWPPVRTLPPAPFTTISHWVSKDWLKNGDGLYSNEKRTGFQPFLDLPRYTSQTLELALWLRKEEDAQERSMLEERGWRVRDSVSVSATPWDYHHYIESSLGEFSCVKPSCLRFQNAWISDRTLCYLASGKPAVMQDTGPSRILPDAAGLFRFRDLWQAASHLEAVAADYDRQCRLARQLAEEFFEAKKVVMSVLEKAL
jgi:hypothetical protein